MGAIVGIAILATAFFAGRVLRRLGVVSVAVVATIGSLLADRAGAFTTGDGLRLWLMALLVLPVIVVATSRCPPAWSTRRSARSTRRGPACGSSSGGRTAERGDLHRARARRPRAVRARTRAMGSERHARRRAGGAARAGHRTARGAGP